MIRVPLACLLSCLLLASCGGLGGEPQIIATVAPAQDSQALEPSLWQPDIKNGERIFAENCSACHGANGDGSGDLVLAGSVPEPPDMTDYSLTTAKSPLDFFNSISDGAIENLMPPWRDALTPQQRWDVAYYTYTLAYSDDMLRKGESLWREACADCDLPQAIPPIFSDIDYAARLNQDRFDGKLNDGDARSAAAYARYQSLLSREPEAIAIRGHLRHGTADGVIPQDTLVQLRFGDATSGIELRETVVNADHSFAFDNLPRANGYLLSAVIADRIFSSVIAPDEIDAPQILTIYDQTNDPYVISLSRIELFLNPTRLPQGRAGLHALQIIRYRNDSDRLFTSGRGFDDGREASLLLQLPLGATLLSDSAGGRYVSVEALENVPDSIIDTRPVLPGDAHEIVVEYTLPYEGELAFSQAFNNLVDADLRLSLPARLALTSDALDLALADSSDASRAVYSSPLAAQRLEFTIRGALYPEADQAAVIHSDALLLIFAGAGGTALLLLGLGFWRFRKPDHDQAIEKLTQQLAALDDSHDRGQINHDVWHQRRRALKAELSDLMGRDGK